MSDEVKEKLLRAACTEDVVRLRALLDQGADINSRYSSRETLLHRAAAYGSLKIVKELLANGAEVNVKDKFGRTPLHSALWYCGSPVTLAIVKAIIAAGAEVSGRDRHLHSIMYNLVVGRRDLGILQTLMAAGARLDANRIRNTDQVTLLHLAETVEMALFLLQHGADVNAKDISQMTPLHYAVKDSKGMAFFRALLKNGADVDAVDGNCRTPLLIAASRAYLDGVVVLLEYGADVNYRYPPSFLFHVTPLEMSANSSLACGKCMMKRLMIDYYDKDYKTILERCAMCDYYPELCAYAQNCIREIIKMKKHMVNERNSLYRFVKKRGERVRPLFSSYVIREEEIITKYPIFHDVIWSSLQGSLHRGFLLDSLRLLHIPFILNADIKNLIAEYLTDQDLSSLIRAFKMDDE